jgi:hypothetical protein
MCVWRARVDVVQRRVGSGSDRQERDRGDKCACVGLSMQCFSRLEVAWRTISFVKLSGYGIQRSTIDNSRSHVSDQRGPDYCLLAQFEHLQDLQEQLPGVEHEVQLSPQLRGSKGHVMC